MRLQLQRKDEIQILSDTAGFSAALPTLCTDLTSGKGGCTILEADRDTALGILHGVQQATINDSSSEYQRMRNIIHYFQQAE